MIPILFAPKAREYNNNGLGVLVDVGYCTVTEERNGSFELELQYPVNGIHYSDLGVDCQILAKPNETSEPQAFRIYNISKPMNGVVTVNAEHISYELSSIIVNPFSASNVFEALSKIKENSVTENPFDFWTDKRTVANMSQTLPLSARSLLGGVEGSVLDTYTGEFEFDNYTVKLHQNRGSDNGVVIAYAKNLTGVKCEERIDGIITGAIAVWIVKDENDQVINEVYGDLQTIQTNLSYSRNVVIDCSSDFDVEPTKEALNAKAMQYIATHKNAPYFSVSVEFVNLGDTEEYKQYKGLYRVKLCDIVTVKHPMYGINVKAKVVKTVFDSVREKYEKIEIGEVSSNISKTIATQEKDIAQKVSFSELDKAVAGATSAIGGNKGGYVVLYPNAKQPQELLILDKPNITEAVNVWRWNLAGLGHSNSGYNGEFSTAITADGQIVADFITTGTLSANRISSGVLSSKGGLSNFSLETGQATFGGIKYYTEISQGQLTQGLQSAGGVVGGFVPIGTESSLYESIFYNPKNCNGISLASQNEEGTLNFLAFFEDSGFNFGRALYVKDNSYRGIKQTRNYNINGGQYASTISVCAGNIDGNPTVSLDQYNENDHTDVIRLDVYRSIGEAYVCLSGFSTKKGGKTGVLELGKNKMWWSGDLQAYGAVTGTNITASSDRKIKKNIKTTKTKNALSSVKSLSVYDYDLKDSGKSVKMGLMADEAPQEIVSEDGKGINLYSYCGMLALAIKELSEKVEEIEKNGGNYGKQN